MSEVTKQELYVLLVTAFVVFPPAVVPPVVPPPLGVGYRVLPLSWLRARSGPSQSMIAL